MKIAAVVVTFNRLNLLKKCILSIKLQTYKINEIIIVNNSSTDGTSEWLLTNQDLTVITQDNLGGAGGFYKGIKSAYEKGYDWIWCMDDDTELEKNALYELVRNLNDNETKILNSIVVSKENKDVLAFGLYFSEGNIYFDKVSSLKYPILKGTANFFNGTLLSREVIKKLGLPLKELFIRGDEYEYFLRTKVNNIKIISITSSIIYHPPEKYFLVDNIFFRYKFLFMSHLKRYYTTRNMIILKRLYRRMKQESIIKRIILDSILILLFEKSFKSLFQVYKGFFDGLLFDVNKYLIKKND